MKPTDEQLRDPDWWRDNDPSGGGATHYDCNDQTSHAWMKKNDRGSWCCWGCENWISLGIQKPELNPCWMIIPRPTPWSGEGLPPAGVEFRFSLNGRSWEDRVMLFNDGTTCLMANKYYPANRWHYKCNDPEMQFRPLQSHRDRVIEKAAESVNGIIRGNVIESIIGQLYDAGMLVDGEAKRMSRDEAYRTLCEELPVLATGHILRILDALGFVEDGE